MKTLVCFFILLSGCSSTKKVKTEYKNYYTQFEKHYGFKPKQIINEFRFERYSKTGPRAFCRYDSTKARTLIVNISVTSKIAQLIYLCESWVPASNYHYIKSIDYWSKDD